MEPIIGASSAEPGDQRACDKCGAVLRIENPGPFCDPCTRQAAAYVRLRRAMGIGTWKNTAECARVVAITPKARDWFYPEPNSQNRHHLVPLVSEQRARRICIRCPVKRECIKTALENDEYGIWGGTTQEDRRWARRGGKPIEEQVDMLMRDAAMKARELGLVGDEEHWGEEES